MIEMRGASLDLPP